MADIDVAQAFTLRLDDGSIIDFKPGSQTVADDVAQHWYVKANLVGAASVPPPNSAAAFKAAGQVQQQAAQADASAKAAADAQPSADAQAKAQDDLQIQISAAAVVTPAATAAAATKSGK